MNPLQYEESLIRTLKENSKKKNEKKIKKNLEINLQESYNDYVDGVTKAVFGKKSYNRFHPKKIEHNKNLKTKLDLGNENKPLMNNKFGKNLINIELNKAKLPYSKKIHNQYNFIESLQLNHTFEDKEKQKMLEKLQREAIYAKIAEIKRSENSNEPMTLYKNHRENYLNGLVSINQNINIKKIMKKKIEKNKENMEKNMEEKIKQKNKSKSMVSRFSSLFRNQTNSEEEDGENEALLSLNEDLSILNEELLKLNRELNILQTKKSKFLYRETNSKTNTKIINNKIKQSLQNINFYIKNPNNINRSRIGKGVKQNN